MVVVHLEDFGGKVWVQRNQTEVDVEAELMALGVDAEDLVRGLVPPDYRVLAGLNG
ncbi:MAG: XisI protein [Alkalinema sp. RU_4_3]|nr:XisI protein [Alkalinema sp. RU_4_3]